MAFLVQLQRNAQGDDPKALESALTVKTGAGKNLARFIFNDQSYEQAQLFQQGKPILLAVWAASRTCYAEHQYLNKLAKQGVTIVGLDYKDDGAKAVKWLKDLGNPYQVVLKDEKGAFGLDLGFMARRNLYCGWQRRYSLSSCRRYQ